MRKRSIKRGQHAGSFQISRRQLLTGVGAATIAGSIATVSRARPAAAAPQLQGATRAPMPIPGGVDAPPVGFIHWYLPGPAGSVTPYLGLEGMGLDVEPSSITNFQGFTTFAVLGGQAQGSDGNTYNVEFDVRVMEGEYVAEDGSNQYGVFGFFWVDLFDPDSGNQVNDMQPGIMPNGLFWTMQLPRHSFVRYNNGRDARLLLQDLPLVETFEFGGELAIPAHLTIDVRWQAAGEFVERGEGSAADPTSPAAFSGNFAEAGCTGWVSGSQTGFSFETHQLTATDYFAEMGEERNGSFLG